MGEAFSIHHPPQGLNNHSGVFACDFVGGTAHYLGSLGHEASDAASFASWGADYLKVIDIFVTSTCFTLLVYSLPHAHSMTTAMLVSQIPSLRRW